MIKASIFTIKPYSVCYEEDIAEDVPDYGEKLSFMKPVIKKISHARFQKNFGSHEHRIAQKVRFFNLDSKIPLKGIKTKTVSIERCMRLRISYYR